MPALPTFNVTDAQAQRLLAAFGSQAAYQEWLKQQIVAYVVDKELEALRANFAADVAAKRAEIIASLTA